MYLHFPFLVSIVLLVAQQPSIVAAASPGGGKTKKVPYDVKKPTKGAKFAPAVDKKKGAAGAAKGGHGLGKDWGASGGAGTKQNASSALTGNATAGNATTGNATTGNATTGNATTGAAANETVAGDVSVVFWTTPRKDWSEGPTGEGSGPNVAISKLLREIVVDLGDRVVFDPQMYVSDGDDICADDETIEANTDPLMPSAKQQVCEDNCLEGNKYCSIPSSDPVHYQITGKSVVEESLRRICVWGLYGRGLYSTKKIKGGKSSEEDPRLNYFDYVTAFTENNCDAKYTNACRADTFEELGIDEKIIDACIKQSGGLMTPNVLLQDQLDLENATYIHELPRLPAIFVDGEPLLDGELKKDYVYHQICSQFPVDDIPKACAEHMEDVVLVPLPALASVAEDLGPPEKSETTVPAAASSTFKTMSPFLTQEEPEEELPESTTAHEEEGEAIEKFGQEDATETPHAATVLHGHEDAGDLTDTKQFGAQSTSEPKPFGAQSTSEPKPFGAQSTSEPKPAEIERTGTNFTGGEGLFGMDASTSAALLEKGIEYVGMLEECGVDTNLVMDRMVGLVGTGGYFSAYDEASALENDIPLLMSQTCPKPEEKTMLGSLAAFHTCSLFNLKEFLETFPSTAVGVIMRCAKAYSVTSEEEIENGFIPEQCIRAIESESMIGRAAFGLFLYPDVACPCMEDLYLSVPECTADVGIIPINGAALKVESCMAMKYCRSVDDMCDRSLQLLNKCMPPLAGVGQDNMVCETVFDKCSEFYDAVPPMFNGAPLPDACQRIAKGSLFYGQHVTERYDLFRQNCGLNQELWDSHTPVEEIKAFLEDDIKEVDYLSKDFFSGAVLGALAAFLFLMVLSCIRCICRWCCSCCCGWKKRPSGKYAAVDSSAERFPEYSDDPKASASRVLPPEYRDI